MVCAALIGEYSLLVMPFILTAMVEIHGIGAGLAGRLVSAQLLAMALASMGAASVITRVPRRGLAVAAILVIIVANMLCLAGGSVAVLAIGRVGTGLGEGTLMAVAAAIIAGAPASHRVYSLVGLAVAAVATVALFSVPFIVGSAGYGGIFAMLALFPLLALVTLPWLPSEVSRSIPATGAGSALSHRALCALLAFALLWVGAGGLWVFAERIGAHAGLDLATVGLCLALGQLIGIAGPVAADRYGLRLGLTPSLVGGCLGMAGGGLLFVFGGSAVSYAVGASLLSFFVMFLVPCFRSFMARLDPGGRVVGASAAFYTLGFALAPALVAAMVNPVEGYGRIALFCAGTFVLAAVLVWFGAHRVPGAQRAGPAHSPSETSRHEPGQGRPGQ